MMHSGFFIIFQLGDAVSQWLPAFYRIIYSPKTWKAKVR